MTKLYNTQTEKNLTLAFFKESEARNLYTYFSSIAKKEGYVHIQNTFLEIANQEKEHAKQLLKYLQGGSVAVQFNTDIPVLGTTVQNLTHAINGETNEYEKMYPLFATIAESEGFTKIAKNLYAIAKAEKGHSERFQGLRDSLEQGTIFKQDKVVQWRCNNCGYIHEGEEAPHVCEACFHPQAHFYAI